MEKNISKIEIKVELDNNKVPEKIRWTASDGNINNQQTKATFLSVWDSKNKESLRIDLWTKDMPVDQMNVFIHQTLVSMSETFFKATQNEKIYDAFKQFCDYFSEKLNLQSSSN